MLETHSPTRENLLLPPARAAESRVDERGNLRLNCVEKITCFLQAYAGQSVSTDVGAGRWRRLNRNSKRCAAHT